MLPALQPHATVADAIALLLHPHAEVVLHDLGSGRIAYIVNNFSRRKVGDPSLNQPDPTATDDRVIGPYAKVNWDGRELRSITAVLRDPEQQPIGLLCINLDVSVVERALTVLSGLVRLPERQAQPASLFGSDWREAINATVGSFLRQRGLSVDGLAREEVRELIVLLDRQGCFAIRTATNHVANVLGLSRATIYKQLKDVRAGTPALVG